MDERQLEKMAPEVPGNVRAEVARLLGLLYPDPQGHPYTAHHEYERHNPPVQNPHEGAIMHFPPHMQMFLSTLTPDDIKKFDLLLALRTETISWISQKNDKELKSFDGAIELVNNTHFAAKVLLVVISGSFTVVGTVYGLGKWGWDTFWFLRGTK